MSQTIQSTLSIIKPDAFEHSAAIKSLILEEGFIILKWESRKLRDEEAREFYKEHQGKSFFERLVEFMTR